MARPRRVATKAEKALWSTVVRDVRPLEGGVAPQSDSAPDPVSSPTPAIAESPPAAAPGPRRPGPVDLATLARLKRGQVSLDGRIDLHGMDQRAAFAALMVFIDISLRRERRTVLVITGKGAAGGGVLRQSAPDWLKSSALGPRILAITPAHVRHGGDGAFYVMLRRKQSRER